MASGVQQAALDPVAAQACAELLGGGERIDPCVVEVLADHVHELAGGAALEALVCAAGCRLLVAPGFAGEALLIPLDAAGVIVARPKRDLARFRLHVLHEVAHWVLGRSGAAHTHADVWALTLALGAPSGVVTRLRREGRLSAVALAGETGLPAWAAELRAERAVGNDNAR